MNSIASKITAVLLSVFLLGYVGYQVFTTAYNPYETEIVKQGTYIHDIDLNGFFIRNEKVLEEKKHGVISYKFKNAEKISRNTIVANIYEHENDLYNLNKIAALEHQKDILEQSQDKQNTQGSKLDALNKQINNRQLDLVKEIDEGNLLNLNKIHDDLMLNMNQVNICINNKLDFKQSIDNLDKQILKLKSQISDKNIEVISKESGYFSNTDDGYEDKFTIDMLQKLNIQDVKKQVQNPKPKPSGSIGKIQYDSNWYFVSTVKTKQIDTFKIGQDVRLKFNSKSTKEVTAKVTQIITNKVDDTSVLIFYGDYLDEDFVTMRFEKPKVIINDLFGVIIPKEAIRIKKIKQTIKDDKTQTSKVVEKEVKGVYTLLDRTVRFKQLDVLYEDNYVLISKPNIKTEYVSVYDKVITKGKNLHETDR